MAKRIFGRVKGMPRPKTDSDWARLFNRHKILLPSIKRLELFCHRHGPGNTGVRLFKSDILPPIEHWNTDLDVHYHKELDKDKPCKPRVVAITHDDQKHEFTAAGLKARDILEKLKGL